MQTSQTILPSTSLNAKLFYIFAGIWSLNALARGYILASLLAIFLFFYYMVMNALYEIVMSILDLWSTSNLFSRVILIGLTVYVVRRLYPYVKLLHRKGIL